MGNILTALDKYDVIIQLMARKNKAFPHLKKQARLIIYRNAPPTVIKILIEWSIKRVELSLIEGKNTFSTFNNLTVISIFQCLVFSDLHDVLTIIWRLAWGRN